MNTLDSDAAGPTNVIFGASGDLTRRKLIPARYNKLIKKRLPAGLCIVGFARRDWSDDQFRDHLGSGVKKYATGFDARVWNEFARNIRYFHGDPWRPGLDGLMMIRVGEEPCYSEKERFRRG